MRGKIDIPLAAAVTLMTLAVVSDTRAMRAIEDRSEQLRRASRSLVDLPERVADNTLGYILQVLSTEELRLQLHAQVKAEHGRGNLDTVRLPWSTAAIDGKYLSPLHLHDLQRETRKQLKMTEKAQNRERRRLGRPVEYDPRLSDSSWKPDEAEIRAVFSTRFPHVQIVTSLSKPDALQPTAEETGKQTKKKKKAAAKPQLYGLIRVHRTTLVSAEPAVCLDQRALPGDSNESGSILPTVRELLRTYGRTGLVQMLTTDAGNTTLEMATELDSHGVHYFLALKGNQPELHNEAKRLLDDPARKPDFSTSEVRGGRTVAYEVFLSPLPDGYLAWRHARMFARVHRVSKGEADDDISEGNRYFISSEGSERMTGHNAYLLARSHWRCENENHWTCDAILDEDERKAPWSRHPNGMVVASMIRMLGLNILAVFRALSHRKTAGNTLVKPAWKQVMHHFLTLLFEPIMDTTAFDA